MAEDEVHERASGDEGLTLYLPVHPGSPAAAALWAGAELEAEKRRLEQELALRTRERNECLSRFHALIEGNGDGIVVVDRQGIVRFANPAAGEMFGRPPVDLVGSLFGHPLVAGETTEIEVLAPGRPPVVVEMRVVNAEWEGVSSHIACLRDITDRRRAEDGARQLIRAQAEQAAAELVTRRFRFLAEAGATLASSVDYRATLSAVARLCVTEIADWVVVYVVDEGGELRRLEVVHRDPARADAARRLLEESVEPADSDLIFETLRTSEPRLVPRVERDHLATLTADPARRQLLEELGVTSYMILPMTARDRHVGALALVSAAPERSFSEEDLALARSLASRTALAVENARLYADARAADQAKTDLIAVISHDLRTPLNSIIGYSDLLTMGVQGQLSTEGRDWVVRIRRSAEHQLHLIDQLLVFSRLDSGPVDDPQNVDLASVLDDVRSIIEPIAHQGGLVLVVEAEEGCEIRTDPDALRQIVLNLATNAVKYTKAGEVRLTCTKEGDRLLVKVSDSGIGIAAEHLEQIFEPFWQVDAVRRGPGGTGLGLSIVRRLARSLGGDVCVTSELGKGSTFTLWLPAA